MSADGVDSLLRAHVVEIPDSVFRAIDVRPELLDSASPEAFEPPGVSSGMIFAVVTRASYSARLNWFQRPDWNRASRLLRGFRPAAPSAEVVDEKSPAGLEAVVS